MTKTAIRLCSFPKGLMVRSLFWFFFSLSTFLFFSGCHSRSLESFQEEGEEITQSLVLQLQSIHSGEELRLAAPRLKELFNQLADLMISARELRREDEDKVPESSKQRGQLSEQLYLELYRLYQIKGGKEIIKKCQEEALYRLAQTDKKS